MLKRHQALLGAGAVIGAICIAGLSMYPIDLFLRLSLFRSVSTGRFDVQNLPLFGIVKTLAFSPDGKFLVAGTQRSEGGLHWTGTVRIWRVEDGKQVFTRDFLQWTKKVTFTNDGRFLAVASSTRSDFWTTNKGAFNFILRPAVVTVYSFPDMTIAKEIELEDIVETISFSPDGAKLAVARSHNLAHAQTDVDQEIEIVDWRNPNERTKLDSPTMRLMTYRGLLPMLFTPDGRRIYASRKLSEYEAFDVKTGKSVEVFSEKRRISSGSFLQMSDAESFWMTGAALFRFRFDDHAILTKLQFADEQLHHRQIIEISADAKRILGFTSRHNQPRSQLYWEDLDEKKSVLAFDPDIREVEIEVCKFSPTDPDVFAVGLSRPCPSAQINPEFPRPEIGPVLLFRLKK